MFDKLALAFGLYIFIPWVIGTVKLLHQHFTEKRKDFKTRYGQKSYCAVLGSTSGIGKELAFAFAEIGFNLILIGKSKDKLEAVKQALPKNVEVVILIADFRKHE